MEDSGRDWQNRIKSADQVRKKLRTGWKYDPVILNQYFQSCYQNWKVYKGDRTPKQVLKLQAIYKQATYGDNEEPPPDELDSVEGQKWQAWHKLKGMTQDMAKRRFITFLAEINPILIDVMPDEKPPIGFPLDRKGNPICAKCNTVVGCSRPLLDQFKMNLRNQLFDHEEFHEPERLTLWIQNAIANQRCVWGVHQPITKAETKPFMDWFNREENRGFFPYDSMSLMKIVRDLVFRYHEIVYDMMQHKAEISAEAYNETARKTLKLKEIFEAFSNEQFIYELPCTRDNDVCNQRRAADGGRNHKHEVQLDPPTHSDMNTMEEAIQLRIQCQKLGLNPCTGVVKNISERCVIYRQRIAEHFENLKKSAEARARNEKRIDLHIKEKKSVLTLAKEILEKQCWEACNGNHVDQITTLIKRGCNPNEESTRGMTPLLTFILNECPIEKIEEVINLKGISHKLDLNMANRHGMTPLMLACRLKDNKMVHVLMKNGASALQKGFNGQTPLHACVIHGNDEAAKIIVEYLKEGVGDAMRVVRFIDAIDDDGDNALIYACRLRNGLMCHLLASLGANPNNRNNVGRTPAYIARSKGWNEIADWIEKKVGAGVKVETYSDQQFEKQGKFGSIKVRELIQNFGKIYLLLVQHRLGLYPLGCPFKSQLMIEEKGDNALMEQQFFVDNHQKYILNRIPKDYMKENNGNASLKKKIGLLKLKEIDITVAEDYLKQLKDAMTEIVSIVRQGFTYPNLETLAQPLAWTPLMCAVALNDIRSLKLLLREGANPNHPNRDGTTPVMLAAQLQEVEILIELLANGGDLNTVDNQGYTALAYASSLPLPLVMNQDIKDLMTNNDISGAKLLTCQQIITTAMNNNKNIEELKEMVKKNYEATNEILIEKAMKTNKLLESFGLTPIDNEHNLLHQVTSAAWRVKQGGKGDEEEENDEDPDSFYARKKRQRNQEDEEDAEQDETLRQFEEENKKLFQDQEKARLLELKAKEPSPDSLRCPICTLAIPCAHFLKINSLMSYLKENEKSLKGPEAYQITADSIAKGALAKYQKKFKAKSRAQEVLEEAQIGDRKTDRSKTFADQYQEHELNLEKNWKERLDKEQEEIEAYQEMERVQRENKEAEELLEYSTAGEFSRPSTVTSTNSSFMSDGSFESIPFGSLGSSEFSSKPQTASSLSSMDSGGTFDESDTNENGSNIPIIVEPSPSTTETTTSNALVSIQEDKPLSADSLGNSSRAVVSILKPPSRDVGESRKSKRVKFNLPGLDEEPPLAITDGTTVGEAPSSNASQPSSASSPKRSPTPPKKEQQLVFAPPPQQSREGSASETALQVLQQGTADFLPKKATQFEVGAKHRLLLFTKEPVGVSTDGFTSIDPRSYRRIPQKVPPPPSSGLSSRPAIPTPPSSAALLASMRPQSLSMIPSAPNSRPLTAKTPFEQVKELLHNNRAGQRGLRQKTLKDEIVPTKLKTTVSGWIFVHLAKITDNIIPLESITINQDAWLNILEHISNKFENEWTQEMNLHLLINIKSWDIEAPRCLLCGIGIVRHKKTLASFQSDEEAYHLEASNILQQLNTYYQKIHGSSTANNNAATSPKKRKSARERKITEANEIDEEEQEAERRRKAEQQEKEQEEARKTAEDYENLLQQLGGHLCLQCVIRKELYLKIQQSMPRVMRQSMAMKWPFLPAEEKAILRKRKSSNFFPPLAFSASSDSNQQSGSNLGSPSSQQGNNNNLSRQASFSLEFAPSLQQKPLLSPQHSQHFFPPPHMHLTIDTSNQQDNYSWNGSLNDQQPPTNSTMSSLFSPQPSSRNLPYHKTAKSPMARSSPLASSKLLMIDQVEAEILRQQELIIEEREQSSPLAQLQRLQSQREGQLASQLNQISGTREGGTSISAALDWLDANNDDDRSVSMQSVSNLSMNSMDSNLSSLEDATKSLSSVASTITIVDPIKRPREMSFLPYLIARGHFEEVERTIRILLTKQAIDEGEGVFNLLKILGLQADMYKAMGLYPLALSLYVDIADITASLLGLTEYVTFKAFGLVMLCYRRMQKAQSSDSYLKKVTEKILLTLRKEQKMQMVEKLQGLNKSIVKEYVKLNNVFKRNILPMICRYSKSSIHRRYYETLDIGGFYSFLTSEAAVFVIARKMFFLFCQSQECPQRELVHYFSHFLDYSFRMRVTDEEDVYRFLVQYVIQKCLSKTMVATSPLAKLFREITPPESIQSIVAFINQGKPLDIRVFDEILFYCLQLLTPIYRFFLYHSVMSQVLHDQSVDLIAEGCDVAAVLIQCLARKRLAWKKVDEKRRLREEERRKKQEDEEARNQARELEEALIRERMKVEAAPTHAKSNRTRRSVLF